MNHHLQRVNRLAVLGLIVAMAAPSVGATEQSAKKGAQARAGRVSNWITSGATSSAPRLRRTL